MTPGATPGPADLLRHRLTHGKGRLLVVAATSSTWLMDMLLVVHLKHHQLVASDFRGVLHLVDLVSSLVFIAVTIGLSISLYRGHKQELFHWAIIYLVFSILQVIINVLSMVDSAGSHKGGGLPGLWDVAAVYMESVFVFMFVYIFLDVSTPGGAFLWPSREGEPAPEPHIIDYLFISLNVNSTYGPTVEAVMSKPVKVIMSLQVLLAIVMLTVLIARAAGASG